MDNLNIEQVVSFFETPEITKIKSGEKLFRYNSNGIRFYFTQNNATKEKTFFLSVTSFSQLVLPTGFALQNWRVGLGKEEADRISEITANYGTLLHILIGEFIKKQKIDFSCLGTDIRMFMKSANVNEKHFGEWYTDLCNDLLSFSQFVHEKNVRVIALEFPISSTHENYKIAGLIDMVCNLDFGKGRVTAIVDFKSGRKGFYDSHELQLAGYKFLWNSLYGEYLPVTHTFNFAPTDWRGINAKKEKIPPTYKLQNQSESVMVQKLPLYLEIALMDGLFTPTKSIKEYEGVLQYGTDNMNCYQAMKENDYINSIDAELELQLETELEAQNDY